MPILNVIDPYANSGVAEGAAYLAGGFIPNFREEAQAQALAARIREADMQQRKLAQEMEFDRQKFGWEQQKNQREQDIYQQGQRDIDAVAKGARLSTGYHPPMVTMDAPERYADWETRTDAAEAAARYAAQGGGTFNQRADGVKTLGETFPYLGSGMPAPVTLPGMTPEIAANPAAAKKYAETYAVDAAKNAAGGPAQIAAANETLIRLQNAESAYRGLKDQGEIGPWAGGAIGQTWDKYGWGNQDAAGLREAYNAAANQLALELRKIYFQGQGAVTEGEQKILSQTLPMLNSADPERALRTLQQMRETAQRVIQRQQGLSAMGGMPYGQPRRQPSAQHIQMLREGLASGDATVAQEFAEEYGEDALQTVLGGGR